MLVVVTDGYDFEFSVEAADRRCQTEESAHIQEIEIIDNLGNSYSKNNLVKSC